MWQKIWANPKEQQFFLWECPLHRVGVRLIFLVLKYQYLLEYTKMGFTAAAIPVSDFNKVFPLEPFSFIPSRLKYLFALNKVFGQTSLAESLVKAAWSWLWLWRTERVLFTFCWLLPTSTCHTKLFTNMFLLQTECRHVFLKLSNQIRPARLYNILLHTAVNVTTFGQPSLHQGRGWYYWIWFIKWSQYWIMLLNHHINVCLVMSNILIPHCHLDDGHQWPAPPPLDKAPRLSISIVILIWYYLSAQPIQYK